MIRINALSGFALELLTMFATYRLIIYSISCCPVKFIATLYLLAVFLYDFVNFILFKDKSKSDWYIFLHPEEFKYDPKV
jgi:hypothetical protein